MEYIQFNACTNIIIGPLYYLLSAEIQSQIQFTPTFRHSVPNHALD